MKQELGHLELDPEVHGDKGGSNDGAQAVDHDQIDVDNLDGVGQPNRIRNHHRQKEVVTQFGKLLILLVGGLVAENESWERRNESDNGRELSKTGHLLLNSLFVCDLLFEGAS